ncbi:ubiquinol-cytochrome-c reductase complex assembly factor 1-like isoform X2 [Stegodyphus dumicola]|uniref:ubiquinol-cytochrome-c reductase complex assembly factor 1-like isoform X2 n=1 Tax=Stegodyphus dumicola TaxID=202533 RepID=UPI0015AEC561|nr:ubiquinol-cytochrome-c reductase complex assembly factor 1-like isoform X2 [Stegodyphus dumicola]
MNQLQLIRRSRPMQLSLILPVHGISKIRHPLYKLSSVYLKCFKSTKCNNLCLQMCAGFHSSSIECSALRRLKESMSRIYSKNTKAKVGGVIAYEKCADGIDVEAFFKHFKLPDTFQSWFHIINLHVWMCIAVTISEKHGRVFRNSLVDSMWSDVELRMDKLEMPSSDKKKNLKEFTAQFNAALIGYDEGLLGDDTVLAASAWRILFDRHCIDPRLLENVVLYIRRQICHLDSLNTEEFIIRGMVSFMPFQDAIHDIMSDRNV